MKIETDLKLDFANVLIRPKRSTINSRSLVNLERTFTFPNTKTTWTGVPIIASNMDTVGCFSLYRELVKYKMITAFNKFYNVEDYLNEIQINGNLDPDFFMVTSGISNRDFDNLCDILQKVKCNWICIDVANGYMQDLVHYCKRVRERFPDKIIVAGNIATREVVEELIINGGVDVCKAGIGSGAACITRLKTGIGMPQLSCVMECSDAAHGVRGCIISDGGITCPGDMVKAFAGGADFVMCGSVFAGHEESEGDMVEEKNANGDVKKFKLFYGMSSTHAMNKYYGKKAEYRTSEGRVVKMPYKGYIKDTIEDYLGGLRSACTYINAKCIKDLPKCATFVRVSQQLNTSLI